MRKLKIAAYHNLPPGGARNVFENVIRGLREKGYQIDLYSGKDFQPKKITKNNFFLPFVLWQYKKFSQKLAFKINQKGYDLALVTNSKILQHPFILRFLKIPKILISQETLRIAYERGLHENYVYKKYYSGVMEKLVLVYSFLGILVRKGADAKNVAFADRLIVNSYFSKENFLSAYGILGKVIYPGIDPEIYKPSSENKRENFILSIGAFNGMKGHDLVIKALSFIPQKKRPFLKILGIGGSKISEKELNYLKKLCQNLGLKEKVQFEKDFFGKNIVEFYQKAYLTIGGHFLEPFGLCPIESMACGTPVIAVKEGGFRETIKDKETGLLVERDPKKLAEAILYLLENKKIWEEFSKQGINWVREKFSLEKMITKLEKEILKIVEENER